MKIGIIGAMEPEVKDLCSKLENSTVKKIGKADFYSGKLYGKDVVVVQCGIGKVNSALRAQVLINCFEVTHIINTGIAGSMASGLGIFDFVLSECALYHDVDVTQFGYQVGQLPGLELKFNADKKMIDIAKKAFDSSKIAEKHKLVTGLVASGDQFVSGGERKAYIKEVFDPACVEMEGCAIAHTAFIYDIPFLIVRCMSDMADDNVESVYNFNEDEAAKISAEFVVEILKEF